MFASNFTQHLDDGKFHAVSGQENAEIRLTRWFKLNHLPPLSGVRFIRFLMKIARLGHGAHIARVAAFGYF